jgi:quinol monooxygenase YgiN
MFVVLWEFEVKPGCEERFESVYGPQGGWAEFFRRDPTYLGTRLARDTSRERIYFTLDSWASREAYETFRTRFREEYERFDAECASLTVAERHIGSLE